MSYEEILNFYQELKENLEAKRIAIIKRNLEKLNSIDEQCMVLCEKIAKIDVLNFKDEFNENQKETLRNLGKEIKEIQKNNEILTKHSLDVINNTLSGILKLVQPENSSYNSQGKSCNQDEGLQNISSITEEA